jgi:hypothetical protein
MSVFPVPIGNQSLSNLQDAFLDIQQRIVTHARIYFRDVPCAQRRADYEAEVVALAWKWFCRLASRGKDARQFISAFARYAARAVRKGCRLCGQLPAKDVLSETAQKRHGFHVEYLPVSTRKSFEEVHGILGVGGQRKMDFMEERLHDNMQSPVPDQAAFRCDFPVWLGTWSERDQRLIREMVRDERTTDLAEKFKMSPGRISQLRREFHEDWEQFCADPEALNDEPKEPTLSRGGSAKRPLAACAAIA